MNLKYSCLLATIMASSTVAFTVTTPSTSTTTRLYGLADDDIQSVIARAVSCNFIFIVYNLAWRKIVEAMEMEPLLFIFFFRVNIFITICHFFK